MGKAFLIVLVIGFSANALTACTTYESTPTPEATATPGAPANGGSILNELHAVLAAKRAIGGTRLYLTEATTRVVLVKQMDLAQAKAIARTGAIPAKGVKLEGQRVWLVVFESDYQVFPPGPNATPPALQHGCVFTILDSQTAHSLQNSAGTLCPLK